MRTQKIARGRRARPALSLLLALGLLVALAPAGLAAAPPPPAADGADQDELWVQPAGPLSWEAGASAAPLADVATITGPAAPAVSSPLVMCHATGQDVSITAGTLSTVVECNVTTSQDGAVYVAANATASAQGGDVEGTFRIGVDGASWPYDRAVSVYTDPLKVRNKVATINGLQPLYAGSHTIRFEVRRSRGSGALRLSLPSITAIFIPNTGTFRTCNNALDGAWTTTSNGSLEVVSCTLNAPTNGYLFFAVNGWFSNVDGYYQAFYRVQNDFGPLPPTTSDVTYRRQNVYNDSMGGGGSDDTFTVTGIRQVTAGTRAVTLRAGKWSGSGPGTVTLNDPNVMAFFFAPGEANAQVCEDQPSESWFTPFQYFSFARRCDMNLAGPSQVFMSADGYSGQYVPTPSYPYAVGPYEMGARLGVDSVTGFATTQRNINVVEDGIDMSDMGFANTTVHSVPGGNHWFYWSGALNSDPNVGTAAVYRLGMSVIAIPGGSVRTFMPSISK